MLDLWKRTLTLLSLVSLPAACPARADDQPAALLARLHHAQAQTSLDDPSLKPWHLKLDLQLFDAKGAPTEQGTIEEWWAGPKQYKIVYTSLSYNATILHNDVGYFRSKGAGYAPAALDLLLGQVVHPMPADQRVHASTPQLRQETFSNLALDCIVLTQPTRNIANPPLGLFPTYCLNPDNDALRLSYDYGSQLVLFTSIGKFQGRSVATALAVKTAQIVTSKGIITTLTTTPLDPQLFVPTDNMEPSQEDAVRLAGSLIAGSKITGDPPIYPQYAKQRRLVGLVVLRAIIGRDGHIQNLTPVSSSDPSFTQAALEAVRTWVYRPYLLNGKPTEVDTTITVNFAINQQAIEPGPGTPRPDSSSNPPGAKPNP